MSQVAADAGLTGLVEEFMQSSLDFNPMVAVYLGLHQYDGRLPDLSMQAFESRIVELKDLLKRVNSLEIQPADKEAVFDHRLLARSIKHDLFSLEDIRPHATNPMFYGDVIEVSAYIKRDYAPRQQRLASLVQHLAAVPDALRQGRSNLEHALAKPALETSLGIYEGMITYYEGEVTAEFEEAEANLKERFLAARAAAVAALREWVAFLKERLPAAHMSFAIGAEKYRRMLATGEMVDLPVEKVLEVGRQDLEKNRREMAEVCARFRPGLSVQEAVREMAKDHPTPETLVSDTVAKLEEVRQFLIDHDIVTVPSEVRCQVRETPPFLRWAFAFMDSPGPFETNADEAYYYLTPVEENWTAQQKEEWLTKFDYYTLQDVSIHEAYPGHYLHFLHMKLVPSRFRQMVWSYSFVEGWAHYVEQMMLEEGFEAADPRYKMAQLAEALLRNSRYVASVMMHTQGMSVDEATRFIMENAYMEETPARSEAVRGTFDPGYLNYTVGKLLLLKLREDYKAEQGDDFNLRRFHDLILAYGAPPVPLLRPLLLQKAPQEIF